MEYLRVCFLSRILNRVQQRISWKNENRQPLWKQTLSISRSRRTARIVFLAFAAISGIALVGCNKNSTSDYLKKKQVQDDVMAALTGFGAKIDNVQVEIVEGWSVDLSQVPFTSEIATQLKLLDLCIQLNLSKTSLNDSQLSDLIDQKILNSVTQLDLSYNSGITDQSVEKLANLLLLRDLNLVGTQITKAGVAHYQKQRQANAAINDTFKNTNIQY